MKLHGNARLSVKGRELLVRRVEVEGWSLSAAAEAAGISDRTARKWLARYRVDGTAGLIDRSSAPMLVATVQEDPPRADRFAGYARERLQRAMASATSAAIAARRDWVVSEDPDLAALRRHEEFKQFEAMYLPSATRTPQRPKLVQRWQMSRFTRARASSYVAR